MCWPLHVYALSRNKESSSTQVIGCCLHCRWRTPPPLLDTSVVFIRAEELSTTLCYQIWSLRLFTLQVPMWVTGSVPTFILGKWKFKWKFSNINALWLKVLCNSDLPECSWKDLGWTYSILYIHTYVLMFTIGLWFFVAVLFFVVVLYYSYFNVLVEIHRVGMRR